MAKQLSAPCRNSVNDEEDLEELRRDLVEYGIKVGMNPEIAKQTADIAVKTTRDE